MTELSPAAQAVFWEFNRAFDWVQDGVPGPQYKAIAAVLRAVADRVVPDQQEPISSPHMGNFISHVQWRQSQAIRTQLLAIADELESQ
jgi:hypothetical protein